MQIPVNRRWAAFAGTLLALPTACFIFISLLKYALNMPFLYDAAQPMLEKLGIRESLGWNINLLLLFGPFAALLLNLATILQFEWNNEKDGFSMKFTFQKSWWNIGLVFFSATLLAVLCLYVIGENFRSTESYGFIFYEMIML